MRKRAGRLFIALTVLVTTAAGYYGWRYWQLARDGITTTALSIAVDRRTVTGKNLSALPWRYVADYTFADQGGAVHSGRETIDRSRYESLEQRAVGAPVAVYYSRSKPYVNTLAQSSPRNAAAVLVLIALLGWGIVLVRGMRG